MAPFADKLAKGGGLLLVVGFFLPLLANGSRQGESLFASLTRPGSDFGAWSPILWIMLASGLAILVQTLRGASTKWFVITGLAVWWAVIIALYSDKIDGPYESYSKLQMLWGVASYGFYALAVGGVALTFAAPILLTGRSKT
jgi:hypothetical protein